MRGGIFFREISQSFCGIISVVGFVVVQEGGSLLISIKACILAGGPLLNSVQFEIGFGGAWCKGSVVSAGAVVVVFVGQNVIIGFGSGAEVGGRLHTIFI